MNALVIAAEATSRAKLVDALQQRGHVAHAPSELPCAASLNSGQYCLAVVAVDTFGQAADCLCAQLSQARTGQSPWLVACTRLADPARLEALLAAGIDDCLIVSTEDPALAAQLMIAEHRAQVSRPFAPPEQNPQSSRSEHDLALQLIDLHERDRKRLAMKIHDDLAQQLTGAMMTLEAAWQVRTTAPRIAEEHFRCGYLLLQETIEQSRQMASAIRPPALDDFGVIPAIEHLLSRHQHPTGPQIRLILRGHWQRLPESLENAVFRIVQEAFTNAVRHSHSDRIHVELTFDNRHILIVVHDWGTGFDPDQVDAATSGPGLRDVCWRARLFGGTALIKTVPGAGTHVRVRLPHNHGSILPQGPAQHDTAQSREMPAQTCQAVPTLAEFARTRS